MPPMSPKDLCRIWCFAWECLLPPIDLYIWTFASQLVHHLRRTMKCDLVRECVPLGRGVVSKAHARPSLTLHLQLQKWALSHYCNAIPASLWPYFPPWWSWTHFLKPWAKPPVKWFINFLCHGHWNTKIQTQPPLLENWYFKLVCSIHYEEGLFDWQLSWLQLLAL